MDRRKDATEPRPIAGTLLTVMILACVLAQSSAQAQVVSSAEPAVAPPATVEASPRSDSLRIAIISDLNERYGDQYYREEVHSAVRRIVELEPDIVLVTGDMVAGQRPGLDYEGMWAAFHEAVTNRLAGVPLAVTPGNHDASAYEAYALEREEFGRQWTIDRLEDFSDVELVDTTDYPFRYSFAMGPVFFVAIDATNRNALSHREQLDWLDETLSSSSAAEHPVRIVFGHFPLYPFTQGRERDYLLAEPDVRERIERLFVERGVTLYASGHHHAFYPGRHPVYDFRLLSVGCLGGGPRVLLGDDREIEDLDDPTERSFVVIDVADGAIKSIDAYRGPEFTQAAPIERSSLPERVGSTDLPILRDDL